MAEIFETAHCIVALGGDIINTVPKYNMTAGEIAVLQTIHGKDAVNDLEPSGTVKRSNRAERARLDSLYSSEMKRRDGQCVVAKLYPGAAARIFQRLDELELAIVQFKPGLAPEGLNDAAEAEMKEIEKGVLLADGLDEYTEDGDDDMDIQGDGPGVLS